MSLPDNSDHFPFYQSFLDSIAILALPIAGSELHGILCGYLCANAFNDAEAYLRALAVQKEKNKIIQKAMLAMFNIYAISKQQLVSLDFEFKLLLPNDEAPLGERAQAFSEWCDGFMQGIVFAGVDADELEDDDSREALQHIREFAHLDYDDLDIEEDDEKALMEVIEYTRMAVLRLSGEIQSSYSRNSSSDIAH